MPRHWRRHRRSTPQRANPSAEPPRPARTAALWTRSATAGVSHNKPEGWSEAFEAVRRRAKRTWGGKVRPHQSAKRAEQCIARKSASVPQRGSIHRAAGAWLGKVRARRNNGCHRSRGKGQQSTRGDAKARQQKAEPVEEKGPATRPGSQGAQWRQKPKVRPHVRSSAYESSEKRSKSQRGVAGQGVRMSCSTQPRTRRREGRTLPKIQNQPSHHTAQSG